MNIKQECREAEQSRNTQCWVFVSQRQLEQCCDMRAVCLSGWATSRCLKYADIDLGA